MKKDTTPEVAAAVSTLAENLREVIGRFVREVRAQARTPSEAHGETLAFLERVGPVSIAGLADARGVKHQSMRLVTSRLAAEGLIEMLPDPEDRRGYLVHLTQAGLDENITARQARTRWIAESLMTSLTPTEMATLEKAVPLLQRLVDSPKK